MKCIQVTKANVVPTLKITSIESEQLPPGDVSIAVDYSSLNYKDALACQGNRGIVKQLPHIPGIDAAGRVLSSSDPNFTPGQNVIVTGADLGQGHWGGWAEQIRVPADWIVPLPNELSLAEAMSIGTAGFTAAQCVIALQRNGCTAQCGEVVVTGATGGVGCLAVMLLAQLGYQVVAVTGKPQRTDWLMDIGASRVIGRDEVTLDSSRPMLSAQWAGAVDTVGGPILNTLIRSTKYGGCVTACGLVAGAELDLTVFPFLLRGVSLCGIASADCPMDVRRQIWNHFSSDWRLAKLDSITNAIPMEDVPHQVQQMLAGQSLGRTLIKIQSS